MSSKTFKSATGGDSELDVRANDCGVFIALSRGGQIRQASTFAASDAPALALAVLEAAGVEPTFDPNATFGTAEQLGHIQDHLHEYVNAQERAAAEAKEQAELEAEALELFNISQGTNLGAWAPRTDRSVINIWVEIAKRAREISGRAEK